MLVFVSAATAISGFLFLSTAVGRLAWLDEVMRQADAFGLPVSDAQYARLQHLRESAAYLVLVQDLLGIPLLMMAGAAIIKAGFRFFARARASWKQTLGVLAAPSVILALRQLVIVPINYVRESMTSATNLAVFLPVPAGGFAARLFGMIDVFGIWWLVVLAIGLGVLYRRPVRRVAMTLLSIYVGIAVTVGVVLMLVGHE